MRTRSVVSFLTKYIPGNPGILIKYMPGGGGRLAGNYIYTRARPDGLTIGNSGSSLVPNGFLGARGVLYEYDKFIYLGSANSKTNYVLVVNAKTGLDTIEKLQAASGLRIGALGVGHTLYYNVRIFTWLLGLKDPKFVVGYTGGQEMDLALMRGEIDIRTNIPDTIMRRSRHWVENKLVHFHPVLEIPKGFRLNHPAFKDLSTLDSFAKTARERKILDMYRTFNRTGSPFFLPPGTPPDRVKILKEAFRKTFKDPEFLKTFRKLTGADATPLMPDEQAEAIRNLTKDPEIVRLYKQFGSADPLPPR